MCECTYVRECVCVCVRVCVCASVHPGACVRASILLYEFIYMCVYVRAHTCVCVYMCMQLYRLIKYVTYKRQNIDGDDENNGNNFN